MQYVLLGNRKFSIGRIARNKTNSLDQRVVAALLPNHLSCEEVVQQTQFPRCNADYQQQLYIELGERDWGVLIYYSVNENDIPSVMDSLEALDCTEEDIHAAITTLRKKNTGFTYTNTDYKMTFVCIGRSTNISQFVNTVVHEAKHVLSHICQYYGIDETSETAAYLIGYLVQRMYKMVGKILRAYLT